MFSLTPEWVENFRCWHVSAERREPKSFASSYLIGTNRLSPTGRRLTRREGLLLPESSCAASRDRGDSATPYRGARVAIFPTAPLQDLLLSRAAGARLMKGKEVGDSGCCSQSQLPTLGVGVGLGRHGGAVTATEAPPRSRILRRGFAPGRRSSVFGQRKIRQRFGILHAKFEGDITRPLRSLSFRPDPRVLRPVAHRAVKDGRCPVLYRGTLRTTP
jgi:hypothetical protein